MGDLTYNMIKKSLDAASLRSKVIANNIANINTPGFKKSDVEFEDKLREALESKDNTAKAVESVEPEVKLDNSSSMRLDGNNVDIDTEMSNMAENSIMYNTLITQLNTKLSVLRYVIGGGK